MMDNNEYTGMVDRGEWPEGRLVPLDAPFTDARGAIQNLVLKPITSIAVITSKARTLRSNHHHKTDWHYIYVVSGRLLYFERPAGSTEIPEPVEIGPGQMFFTPPLHDHATAFLEDTVLVTAAKNVRSHESHEEDLVRVDFVSPSHLGW